MERLIFSAGSQVTLVAGDFRIFGTSGAGETVILFPSDLGPLSVSFDPSFNEGGDRIVFVGSPSDFSVSRSGSTLVLSVVLEGGGGITATIPVGVAGTEIAFVPELASGEGETLLLRIDESTQTILIGDVPVEIGDPVPLGSTQNADEMTFAMSTALFSSAIPAPGADDMSTAIVPDGSSAVPAGIAMERDAGEAVTHSPEGAHIDFSALDTTTDAVASTTVPVQSVADTDFGSIAVEGKSGGPGEGIAVMPVDAISTTFELAVIA